MKNPQKRNGFTLIELLVTTTIIVILMSVGIVAYNQAGKSARDAKRKTDLEAVRQAMMLYRADEGEFPWSSGYTYDDVVNDLIANQYLLPPAPQDPLDTALLELPLWQRYFNTNVYAAPSINYEYAYVGSNIAFCICGPMESGKGNSTANANASCSGISTTGTTYYCVKGF